MNISGLLNHIYRQPDAIQFVDCIEVIDKHFHFTPTAFVNGSQKNQAGENNGSCKIFAFGLLYRLTEQQTLSCFGDYYRRDVVGNPQADDHQNIRQFMLHGWSAINFSGKPLIEK